MNDNVINLPTKSLLTDEQRDARIDAQIRPRVTKERIESRITHTEFIHHGLLTICVLTMVNGFTVTGESACVHPENYDPAVGDRVAKDNAFQKLWPLEGYLLAEALHQVPDPTAN
jgi:hypothetical protein